MEYPSLNHHQNRYLPPQQQPGNTFSDDHRHIYPNHHFMAAQPPPPPPLYPTYQPQPPPPPPPPPSYNPHHPPFTYLEPNPRVSVRYEAVSDPLRVMYPPSNYRNEAISDSGYYNRFRDDNIVVNEQSLFNERFSDRLVVDNKASYGKMSEDERIWNSHGEDDPKWVMKGKKNESGKFRDRGRDGRDEFKQVQKKSVLQRIGKPNNTNRNNRNSRGKAKDKEKDRDRDRDSVGKDRVEGVREKSPVELDVSFQSNGLVAKAVATPSSPLSDTPSRNRKVKRGSEFGSPVSKFGERLSRSGGSSHGVNSPSSSEKVSKKVKGKGSVSDGQNGSLSGAVLGDSAASHKPLSFRLRKKRKMNIGSTLSSFQSIQKDEKIKSENLKNSESAPIDDAVPFPTLEEAVPSEMDKASKAMVLANDGLEVENPSVSEKVTIQKDEKIEKSENLKNSESAPIDDAVPFPTLEEAVPSEMDKASKAMVLANDGLEVENPSVSDKVTMISDGLVIAINQPGENEISLNHENVTQKISAEVNLSLRGDDISATSGQGEIESFAILDAANVSKSVETHETSTALDINSPDPCSDDDVIIVSSDSSDSESSLEDSSSKEDECQLLEDNGSIKLSEDGPIESQSPIVVAEDNVIPCSSFKESSSGKDEVTEMANLVSISGQALSHDNSEPSTDETNLLPENELPPLSSTIFDTGAVVTDINDQLGESVPGMSTNIVSSDKGSSIPDLQLLSSKSTDKTVSTSSIPKNDDSISEKSDSKDDALFDRLESFVEKSKAIVRTSNLEGTKTIPSTSQGSSVKTPGFNPKVQGPTLPMKKPSSAPVVPRVFPGRSSMVFTNSRVNNPATNNNAKPRTWHRSTSNFASLPPPPKQPGQNSYVRSGNSLVRKPAPPTAIPSLPPASRSSVYKLNPSAPTETRNSAGLGNKAPNTYTRTGGSAAPVVRPNTPPLSGITKLPDCPTHSRDVPSSPLEQRPASPFEENLAVQKVSEDRIGSSSNSESQKTLDEGAAGKKMQYVKPKSNQLVAASSSDQSVVELDKARASSSDGYYKRRKNQLIRTSAGNDSGNTVGHKDSKMSIKRHTGIGIYKKYKHLRFPSVWTLGSQSGKDGVPLHQKLRPNLFPWKRSRNWVNVMNVSASIPSTSSSSSISRKLLVSRKRETLYTRSKHGFSLRMSKLRSVGGSSLKWSKSIEKNSRRANEEATLAVAAAEKRKREQNGTASTPADQKRSSMSRDRIFRVGLVRYKMDPSRRTLQRISEEESSTSVQSNEVARSVYVPKRLKIGHDEYVRFGNGNQLVRNPKRRTRIFASEKVRWSLHTARSRLAKKKKYCQFFTRFGKCNKDDGKCPYIHDSSKIAVCTKFLNGSCSNTNCNLTHKVIPERMQDCSYFMQGVCSNKQCPYRHVNVNSAASVCEGFLKGYCADGDECRKKHTYACPVFEATGACPQGTKCKLHHPKNRKTGLKRKQQHSVEQNQKNSRGRYFGSISGGEATPISEKHYLRDDDGDAFCQGELTEYISLGFSDEEVGEVTSGQRTTVISSESIDLGVVDLDELTKPVRIMNRIMSDNQSVS